MKIRKVEIHNWRSIVDQSIDFNDLMIFIGRNNHGKSNVLSALLFFFGEIQPNELDYCNKADEIWVEVEFGELNDEEKTTFAKYVTAQNTIRVRRSASKQGGDIINGYLQIPKDPELRESAFAGFRRRDQYTALPYADFMPKTGTISQPQARAALNEYIEKNADAIEFEYQLEELPFLGHKNVAKGIFGGLVFIPSVKRASDELATKGQSAFAQLYSRVIASISSNHESFREAELVFEKLAKVLNKAGDGEEENEERPTELTKLESVLEDELKLWGTKIDIEIETPNAKDLFRLDAKVWVNDGVKTDIERKGHGLQRALVFALLKAWARTVHEEKVAVVDGEESAEAPERKKGRHASASMYFIFEEPELFLHPQAQRELYDSLVELTDDGNQIILCTHSSAFLSLDKYESICIVNKDSVTEGSYFLRCSEDLFENLDEKKRFNLSYYINPDRGELFFADKVVLVEGQTEKAVIPYLAKRLGVFRHGVTLIDCTSKDQIPLYVQLLNKFRLRYVVVYDKDHQAHKDQAKKDASDESSQKIEDLIDARTGRTIILVNDIEEEIGMDAGKGKGKPLKALKHIEQLAEIPAGIAEKLNDIYA